MKVCPQCSFSNDEGVPTCVLCHTVLVDVPSTPSADPNDPEHERQAVFHQRHNITRRQISTAGALYALTIALTAALPGFVWNPLVLLLYFVSGLVVAVAVSRDIAGQFTASLVQGVLSILLIYFFGPIQPFIVFMLVGHLALPTVLWHWMDMIHSANR